MSQSAPALKENISIEGKNCCVFIGKLMKNSQITVKATGWSDEQKEHMRSFGYDGLDIVREWYS